MGSQAQDACRQQFVAAFGRPPEVMAHAPGRVNLIGEHTDYSGGWVLPTPVACGTWVALAPRTDSSVQLGSDNRGRHTHTYDAAAPAPRRDWTDYVQGMQAALGVATGADVWVASDLPLGAGLSSSAALAVAFGRALRACCKQPWSDIDLARASQRSENDFVGAHVGIMDPMAASVGRPGFALHLHAATLQHQQIALPAALELLVLHTGVTHELTDGAYNARRQACEAAAGLLGLAQLSDATPEQDLSALPAALRRRARHVVGENARVAAAVRAIEGGDLIALGHLVHASHVSLRDDYEVSVPEADAIVACAMQHPAVLGARIVGGGFGGCVLVLAHSPHGEAVRQAVTAGCGFARSVL